jgi:hypothetical protein
MPVSATDIAKIAEGFKGRFYMNGNRVMTCTQWRIERTANRDDFQVLDDVMEYSKLQRVRYQLVFEEYVITHDIQAALLQADREARDALFRFIGEEERGDGSVATWVVEDAYSVDQTVLAGAQVGELKRGTFNFRTNSVPTLTNPWS